MKKNVMMRLAAILLVCVLASTCGISGTYAKYVTSDNGSDVARVAKFGVVATVDGTLFSTTYKNVANLNVPGDGDTTVLTVVSSDADKLVAPGTNNTTGMNFVLTGTPEVDVYVEFKFEVLENKEIKLAAGNYTDNPTTGKENDSFKVDEDYYPVVFTLWKDGIELISGNVATIQAYLSGNLNKTYDAGHDLSTIGGAGAGTYTLTWVWAFGNGSTDVMDTYLGNAAVGGTFPTTGATTDIKVQFTISVTQVD